MTFYNSLKFPWLSRVILKSHDDFQRSFSNCMTFKGHLQNSITFKGHFQIPGLPRVIFKFQDFHRSFSNSMAFVGHFQIPWLSWVFFKIHDFFSIPCPRIFKIKNCSLLYLHLYEDMVHLWPVNCETLASIRSLYLQRTPVDPVKVRNIKIGDERN